MAHYIGSRRTLLGGGGALPPLAAPVPVLGAELLTNGNFSAWSGDNPTGWFLNWTENATNYVTEVAGKARIVSDNGASVIIYQSPMTAGAWYSAQVEISAITGAGKIMFGSSGTIYTREFTATGTIIATGRSTNLAFFFGRVAACDFTADNITLKAITLSSMFSARPYSTHATTKAAVTLVAGTQAGVVANLDSATSPQNFVSASHDGTTARLTKCVAGTYTELISATTAYSAGAYVEVRRAAGTNDYELYYNGSKVGTTQTIADAGITGNVLHGMFNSFSGNSVTGFSCVPL